MSDEPIKNKQVRKQEQEQILGNNSREINESISNRKSIEQNIVTEVVRVKPWPDPPPNNEKKD